MVRSLPIGAVLAVLAAGCGRVPSKAQPPAKGQGAAAPSRARPTLYVPGEQLVWEVRWVEVLMGRLAMAAGRPGEVGGRPAIIVRTEGRTDGVLALVKDLRAEAATMLDLADGLPIAIAGGFDDLYAGDVLDDGYRGTTGDLPWKPYPRELAGGAPSYETHAALGMLRAWDASAGERLHFYGKVNGFLYRTDVVCSGRHRLSTVLGRVTAVRLDGIVTPARADLTRASSDESYRWILWISDDARRIPVRLHVESGFGGTVKLDLLEYDAPANPL